MKIDRRALFMPMIQEAIEKHREDESLQDVRIENGEEAYQEEMVLSVYDDIQRIIDHNEFNKVLDKANEDDLVFISIYLSERIHNLEKELYRMKEGNIEAAISTFYTHIPNEKIELMELIESQVYQII